MAAALFILSAAAATPASAQTNKAAVAPPSKWIVPVTLNNTASAPDPADPAESLRWMLIDRQINAKNDEQFYHWVRRVVTAEGARKASRITIEYNPAYEAITMHWLRIRRGTNVLNRLDTSTIQTIVRESGAADLLFGATAPATLLLDDVRPGDIVDWAYSIDGSNPAVKGMFAANVPVQYDEPVDHLVTRLVWPPPRKFYIQNHGTEIYPSTAYRSNMVEYTWNATAVPALQIEPQIPIWFNPTPWVQLSECPSWADVNKWGLKFFAATNAISTNLAQKIAEWKNLPNQESRALAALRFVQEEIRTAGPESGTAAKEPATPSEVFARQFGDCNDKVRLLVTVFHSLDIEACPLLVNTRERQTVTELHASPLVFDRAIVQATVNNHIYYMDCDAKHERGPLASRCWPNYGFGLPIRPGVTALTAIPPCSVLPKTTVSEYFHVGSFDQEAGVAIITVAEGSDAKMFRELFATIPLDQIERDFRVAQAEYYPEIHSTAPIQFTDDENNNRFQITENYSIPRFWKRRAEEQNYYCHFYSFNIDNAIHKPENPVRAMPLGIDYPVHQVFHAEVNGSAGLPLQSDNQSIQNPAFSFSRTMNIVNSNLVIDYEYRSLADVVMPAAVPTYARQLDSATQFLGCTVLSY